METWMINTLAIALGIIAFCAGWQVAKREYDAEIEKVRCGFYDDE